MSKIRKIALRIVKWGLPIVLSLLIILISLGAIFQERVVGWIVDDLQKELTIPVRIEKIDFSLIENFPHASVIIKNSVALYPNSSKNDTLFTIKRFYINLDLISLIRGKASIQSIELNGATFSLITQSNGHLPEIKIFKSDSPNTTNSTFNINYIAGKNIHLNYHNRATESKQRLSIVDFKFSGTISEKSALGRLKIGIAGLQSNNYPLATALATNATIDFTGEYEYGKKINIDKLNYNSKYLSINGNYNITLSNKSIGKFHLLLDIPNKDLLGQILQPYQTIRINALKSSSIDIVGKINGPEAMDISLDAVADLNGASLTLLKDVRIDNIDTRINLSAKIENNTIIPKVISIEPTKLSLQEKELEVSLKYTPQQHQLNAMLKGDVSPSIFSKVFKISSPVISGENIHLDASVASSNFIITNINPDDLNFQGTIDLSNLSVELPTLKFKSISGALTIGETLEFKHLSLDGSLGKLDLSGSIPHWRQSILTAKNRLPLEISGTLSSPYLNLNLPEWGISDAEETTKSIEPDTTQTPLVISKIEVNFSAKKIAIRQLAGVDARGTLVYLPKNSFSLKNVSLSSFGGKAFFNLDNRLVDKDNTISISGKVRSIYVDSLFKAFNNFDLTLINHENLSGKLDAELELKGVYINDKLLNNKLYCLATLEITDGCLKKYEPLKKLSGFINLKELERINFKRLKNTIRIENDEIVIPEMFIENSALNINLSGIHKLSGNFDYRMRIKLNDLLWAKKKSANQFRSDLGIVEQAETDGGSLFVKVIGTPDDFKFSYDKDRAVENLGKRLKQEGTILHNIFKNEKVAAPQPANKKNSGFVISDPLETKEKSSKADTTKPTQLKKNSGFKIVWE